MNRGPGNKPCGDGRIRPTRAGRSPAAPPRPASSTREPRADDRVTPPVTSELQRARLLSHQVGCTEERLRLLSVRIIAATTSLLFGAAAYRLGQTRFNLEIEKTILLNLVSKALATNDDAEQILANQQGYQK